MNRVVFKYDERGLITRICADKEVEVYIVSESAPHDRVYRWSSLEVGPDKVGEELDRWPVGDEDHMPAKN